MSRIVMAVVVAASASCLMAGDPMVIGLTRSGKPIGGFEVAAARGKGSRTVVVLGGLGGADESSELVKGLASKKWPVRVLAVPVANPEKVALRFPPAGKAYRENTESFYLWRWIVSEAPDLVLIAGADPGGLLGNGPAGVPVKAFEARWLREVPVRSTAGRERERRVARSPKQVAEALEPVFGHEFPEAVYIPAMALMARLRMGFAEDVARIAAPYRDGAKDSLAKATASHLSGHLLFGELAERTGEAAWTRLVKRAADLGFDEKTGAMRESMPYHNEMSDSVFMGCPILAKAGKLTGERKYFDMALRQFRFMQKLDRRPDGIYRHSPLHETAWGRGNAFPALGLALTLQDFPRDHPGYGEMLAAFQELMAKLARYQTAGGMWREVVDLPGAYPEFSATAMIGRAMLLGVRQGWLPAKEYRPRVEGAWKAVSARVSEDGQVFDVCESTGKQGSLRAYLDREAIVGKDPRGGGMALIFAVEMMAAAGR